MSVRFATTRPTRFGPVQCFHSSLYTCGLSSVFLSYSSSASTPCFLASPSSSLQLKLSIASQHVRSFLPFFPFPIFAQPSFSHSSPYPYLRPHPSTTPSPKKSIARALSSARPDHRAGDFEPPSPLSLSSPLPSSSLSNRPPPSHQTMDIDSLYLSETTAKIRSKPIPWDVSPSFPSTTKSSLESTLLLPFPSRPSPTD